jgi:hypothetical protein
MGCRVCGDNHTVAKDRCPTCYQFYRRNHNDRSEKHIIRLTERDIEREWEQRGRDERYRHAL